MLDGLEMLFYGLRGDTYDMLTLPIFDHVQCAQRFDNVYGGKAGQLGQVFNGQHAANFFECVQNHPGPVTSIA